MYFLTFNNNNRFVNDVAGPCGLHLSLTDWLMQFLQIFNWLDAWPILKHLGFLSPYEYLQLRWLTGCLRIAPRVGGSIYQCISGLKRWYSFFLKFSEYKSPEFCSTVMSYIILKVIIFVKGSVFPLDVYLAWKVSITCFFFLIWICMLILGDTHWIIERSL